ncbi:ROK family transcriptional regulator [Amaricoccus sp.]|uniref:ROK family transcriptional regulator n=1 Tax=Amaricoccus sp. TaxID=1872485 RepID=UPI001B56F1A8|nr:ROK family transcriptional regulator [Amaricoccus sp.]MBP7000878.1 ROK family transcriptional regulator [Amaricoccus sp.]
MTGTGLERLTSGGGADSAQGRIVRAMRAQGPLSAAELARATGLARSTVSTALAGLRKSGLVVEAAGAPAARGVGRPSAALTLNPEAGTCVGLHLGLEDVRVMVADVSHSVISEKTIPLSLDYAPEAAAEAARAAAAAAYAEAGLAPAGMIGVGVSVSGPVAPDGTVHRASIIPGWAGLNIREVFEPAFGRPIFADNESNCAAIAEMTWGAAVGEPDFVLFKVDLGVGGAIVANGRLVKGVAGGGGEFGHVSLDPAGELCRCGNRGCLEISASFARPLAELSRLAGRAVDMDAAIRMAEAGDAGALGLIEDTAGRAGRGLAMVGTMLNPPLILIGGRMALAGDLLMAPLVRAYERQALIKARGLPPAQRTRIAVGRFTETDSLLGAVGLVLRDVGRLG